MNLNICPYWSMLKKICGNCSSLQNTAANANIEAEKALTDTQKATLETKEAKIYAKEAKHSTEKAMVILFFLNLTKLW